MNEAELDRFERLTERCAEYLTVLRQRNREMDALKANVAALRGAIETHWAAKNDLTGDESAITEISIDETLWKALES